MSNLGRCPICQSVKVTLAIGKAVSTEATAGGFYYISRTHKSCQTCGHVWDRLAQRGVKVVVDKPIKRGWFAELLCRAIGV
jgi:hypothetical protein